MHNILIGVTLTFDDSFCMEEFTPGQVTLMHDMWHTFRI